MSKAEGSDASKLSVVEVKGAVLGGGSENGAVSLSPGGQETGLLVRREVVPQSFGLEVVEDVSDASLKGFYLKLEGLLKVKKVTWRLSCARVAKCVDPNVGGLKVCKEVCGLFSVDGCEG